MEEAKTLLHHALTAMFAALVLGGVMGLIVLGHMMWSAFAKQDAANARLREYAKYSAFDGTTVRGQEVVALLHDTQGAPWVLVTDKDGKAINIIFTMVDFDFSFSDTLVSAQMQAEVSEVLNNQSVKNKSIGIIAKELSNYSGNIDSNSILHTAGDYESTAMNYSSQLSKPTYSEVQEWFLARGELLNGTSGYLPYKSYLVYEDSVTTDIIGIILVEQETD